MKQAWILLLVLALCACPKKDQVAHRYPACTPHGFTSPGEQLPDCSFEGFNGSADLTISELRGKPAVVNFWASWCRECIAEMPGFEKVNASLEGRVTFVGMNVIGLQGETKQAGATFARRTGVRYRVAYDPAGLLYLHFAPSAERPIMPITVFVDARGIVKQRHFGPLNPTQLRKAIHDYLGVA